VPWWVWIVLGGVLLVAEVFLPTDFFLVFFGVAALVLGIVGLVAPGLPPFAEWLLYAVLSVMTLLLFRRRLQRRFTHDHVAGVDSLVGQAAIAREPIAPGSRGQVELRGTVWTAKNSGTVAIQSGDRCVVESVDGLTLDVRRSAE